MAEGAQRRGAARQQLCSYSAAALPCEGCLWHLSSSLLGLLGGPVLPDCARLLGEGSLSPAVSREISRLGSDHSKAPPNLPYLSQS